MSPVAFHSYRSIQTTLDLNGPTIEITENPSNIVTQPAAYQTPFGPATGALPIRNTDDAATVALDTFRTDANKDQLVLAMPFNNSPQGGDVSALVRGSGTKKILHLMEMLLLVLNKVFFMEQVINLMEMVIMYLLIVIQILLLELEISV